MKETPYRQTCLSIRRTRKLVKNESDSVLKNFPKKLKYGEVSKKVEQFCSDKLPKNWRIEEASKKENDTLPTGLYKMGDTG